MKVEEEEKMKPTWEIHKATCSKITYLSTMPTYPRVPAWTDL